MKKNVWIINHYAGGMLFKRGGRHYWFSKYLKKDGYEPVVFCCNAKHGDAEFFIDTDKLWVEKKAESIDVPFVFVRSNTYSGNGKSRILNMTRFYFNVKRAAEEYARLHGVPDIIVASSVHPLTLVAGIKLAKKYGVKCICEIRDLWPLSLVAYNIIKDESILCKILYQGEKWIYRHADQLIFTFPGGADYIKDKSWDDVIDLSKVHYINNGIDLDGYTELVRKHSFLDQTLEKNTFKVLYAGAMGPPNQINVIVDAAQQLQNNGDDIEFNLFGDGICRETEEARCRAMGLGNIVFKGRIEREKIPYVLSRADATIIIEKDTLLTKYGTSENKVFEYLASGKPIICNDESLRHILGKAACLIDGKPVAESIVNVKNYTLDEYQLACESAKSMARLYNYQNLTHELQKIINNA